MSALMPIVQSIDHAVLQDVIEAHWRYLARKPGGRRAVLAYVDLDDGPRVLTNMVGPSEQVAIGLKVEAVFERDLDGAILRFRPVLDTLL